MRTTGPPGRARARTRDTDTDTDGGQGFDGRSTDGADDAGDRGDLEGGSGDSGGRDGDDGEPRIGCTNGIPEAGEVCDDGNVVDGEGSNNDCEVFGITVWRVDVDDQIRRRRPQRRAASSGGGPAHRQRRRVAQRRCDATGVVRWSTAPDGDDFAGMDIADDDEAVVYRRTFDEGERVNKIDPDAAVVWETSDNTLDCAHDVVASGGRCGHDRQRWPTTGATTRCRAIRIWPSIWTRSGGVVAGRHLTVLRP